jgi:hypothetical protein
MTPDEIAAMRRELAAAKLAWEENGRVMREMVVRLAATEQSLQAMVARVEAALRRAGLGPEPDA